MNLLKKSAKRVIRVFMALPLVMKVLFILISLNVIIVAWDLISQLGTAKNTVKDIYTELKVEDLKELVEIKESPDGSGYYLDFVEGIDEKVEKIVENSRDKTGLHNLPQTEAEAFIKKLIKAEVITQFPNLGGNIPEDSEGFQGSTSIRRVTPNKKIGSIEDNPGRGESSAIEQDQQINDVNENPNNEELVKTWKQGKKLMIKGEATIYEQTASLIKPGQDTGHWYEKVKKGSVNEYETMKEGTEVTYTGAYKKATNALTKETVIYVEVENSKKEKVFVRSTSLMTEEDIQEVEETEENTEENIDETAQQEEVKPKIKANKIAGKEGETYTIAIAAGHNNTDNTGARKGSLVEEKLTIKTAEKVEELLGEYTNIKVVQTGSTSSNRGGVKKGDRTKLARKANPTLCIQIHYDAGGGSGVQAIYKKGDNVSKQLAEFLSSGMASSMGLPNKGAGPDNERTAVKNLGIIESAAKSGFPSVVTEGGFIDGNPDAKLLKSNGTELCAKGIVDGILKYLEADHSGLVAVADNNESTQTSIESKVYDLKYVKEKEMEKLIKNNDQKALKVFSLDKDNNLMTATWNSNNGEVTVENNTSIDLSTVLEKYVMPYEYLLYFYIDSNEKEFSELLAEEVLNTEIVIAVQDEVTTTKTIDETKQKQEASIPEYNYEDKVINTTTNINEVCTPKIEVTYADTWCVKSYKESSYSKKSLNWDEGQKEKIINVKGSATRTQSKSYTTYSQTDQGEASTGKKDANGKDITYTYTKYERVDTEIDELKIEYDSGTTKTVGNENKFVEIYQKTKMYNWQNLRLRKFFMIIEKNEKTNNLLDLTKYLIYKATSDSYGVIEYDFSEYQIEAFAEMSGIYGNTLQEKVWFALKGLGYSDLAVAGAMGNIDLESGGFKAGATEKGGTGIGLIQWSFGRADQLRAYAKHKGTKWQDEDTQIEFLITEISGKGPAKGYATQRKKGWIGNEKVVGTYKQWANAKTIEDATLAFMRYFESPASKITYNQDGTWGKSRLKRAKEYLKQFQGREAPSGEYGSVTLSGNNKQKMEALLKEAVRIANDPRCTYSQPNRFGTYQYDCSSLVYRLYKKFFKISVPTTTRGYGSKNRVGSTKTVKLQPGDVLWRKGHVIMYIGNGKYVAAHGRINKAPKDQISVYTDNPRKYTYVYRFVTN